ncbi:FAD:protein FMN transferase [Schlesneria sp. T3-172]|uniref:FAD:protein FMN transferase n=1 Tax=Schlesneria sphaerica TaxID=3373610 RepID=UPI0037C6D20C
MATQIWKLFGTVIVSVVCSVTLAPLQADEKYSFAEPHLGTIVEITLYAADENGANQAAQAAFRRVKDLDHIFSDYKPDSEVMRLCARAGEDEAVAVSPELFHLLKRSIEISNQTNGAFDVTIGPLVQLWRQSRKRKVLPTQDEIQQARSSVGWKFLVLDDAQQTVKLTKRGMRLDFGGIAKGYVAQEMSRILREQGFDQSLVAVAGDIVAGNSPPGAAGWKVGVAPLDRPNGAVSRLLSLRNCAVSTSGDAFQFVEIAGVRYSHIVDPQTGLGLTYRSSVTVVAPEGAIADSLATAICILGPERGLPLLDLHDQTAALVVHASSDGPQVVESKSFATFEAR